MMRKDQNLLTAAAVAAVMAISGAAFGQGGGRDTGGAGGGAGLGPSQPSGGGGAGEMQRGSSGSTGRSGMESRGSNARGAQGPERREMAPGDRGSNARGAQGPERGRSSTTGQGGDRMNRSGTAGQDRMNQSGTTGQGSDRSRSGTMSRDADRDRSDRNRSERFDRSERSGTTGQGSTRSDTDRTGTRSDTSVRSRTDVDVNINADQRSRIHNAIIARRDVPRVSRVNFDVRVGSTVPRSVRFVSVPEEIVRINPRFRRHRVFIVENEIVIVDPVSFRIVAVIPA
jgi:hypothetical protein